MNKLPIVTLQSKYCSVLYDVASHVERITPEIQTLARQMVIAAIENDGCGLAANQVGALVRVIVVKVGKSFVAMINPVVSPYGPLETREEGCLSNPGFKAYTERQKCVTVSYRDVLGKLHRENYSDLTARIIQHEVDHLNGINIHQKNQLAVRE